MQPDYQAMAERKHHAMQGTEEDFAELKRRNEEKRREGLKPQNCRRAAKRLMGMDDVFDFGKYEGKSVGVAVSLQPSYIDWVSRHVKRVSFDQEVKKEVERSKARQRDRRRRHPFISNP